MKRWIAHVDMDCFFVAVERLYNPSLIGRPVVVGGHSPRSVVAAASYEARAFGVFSAMPTVQAQEKCRDLVIVRPNFERYSKASKTVFSILRELAPIVEPVSVDEAYLDFTGCDKLFPSREDAGLQIKKRILSETRLVASVGMSSNRMISKIASDLKKPDALVYVREGEERTFLQDLSIAKIPGVGKKTVPTLIALGIRTCGDLAAKDRTWVQKSLTPHLGKWSLSLYERAQGLDPRPVGGEEAAKSIGAEETFTRDLRRGCPRVLSLNFLVSARNFEFPCG
jgi:DNA polymerase-4